MKLHVLIAVVIVLTLGPVGVLSQTGELRPIILIYSPFTPDWGARLAQLVESDGRFDADVYVVDEKSFYEVVVNFPRVEAVVLCPLSRPQAALDDISNMTVAFFKDGGAVIGIGTSCTTRYAPKLGPEVFTMIGNRSIQAKKVGGRRVFVYHRREVLPEINGGIEEDTFELEGYLFFYPANKKGEPVEIPANGTRHVLYVAENGAPLVVAYKANGGGASVAFPGLTVQEGEGRDNYYGYLFEREQFTELFLNSLKWAIDNSPRFERLKDTAASRLEAEASRREELAREAERLQRRVKTRRYIRLAILWLVGIAFCSVVTYKVILVRENSEEKT